MAVLELKRDPTPREVRWFCALWLPAAMWLIGGMVWYATGSLRIPLALGSIGLALGAAGLVVPLLGRLLFLSWMYATYPLGWAISHLLLAAIFYGVMTPIGLLRRVVRRDPLFLRLDRSAKTYWTERAPVDDMDSYFRQF